MMHLVSCHQAPDTFRSHFSTDKPQARRCFAVLDGMVPGGKIFTDGPANPSWGLVWELHDGVDILCVS